MIRKIVFAAGILLAAFTTQGPAQAQVGVSIIPDVPIPAGCTAPPAGSMSWPAQNIYNCGATATDLSNASAGLNNVGGFAGKWFGKTGYTIFLYPTQAAYAAQSATFGANYVAPTSAKYSLSKLDTNNNPLYSVIFEKNGAGVANPYFEYSAAREVAKNIDYALGFIANGGVYVQPNISYSNSTTFTNYQNQLTNGTNGDWKAFIGNKQCTTSGSSGVFTGVKSSTGIYICNGTNGTGTALNSAFSSTALNNQQVLQKAWPDDFGNGSAGLTYQPTFAAVLAANASGGGTPQFYNVSYATTYPFQCTGFLERFITSNGSLPTTASGGTLGTACPALATAPGTASNPVTGCKAVFYDSNFPAQGYINDCTANQSAGSEVAGYFRGFGGAPAAPVGKIKANLAKVHSSIYIVDSAAQYSSVFTTAFGATAPSLAGAVAGTYKKGNAWYTIAINPSFGSGAAEEALQLGHELGHVFDDIQTTQPSSLTQYNTAMQNDWLSLNYVDYASGNYRQPCWVEGRYPANATYTGPLVGQNNPNGPNLPFCTNGVLNNTKKAANGTYTDSWNFHGAGSAYQVVSDIILAPEIYGTHNALYPPEYQPNNGAAGAYTPLPGWREWHAESMAIQAKPDVAFNGTSYWPLFYGMYTNGYFQCTGTWSNVEYTTGVAVTSGYPCQTSLPAGWVDIKVN